MNSLPESLTQSLPNTGPAGPSRKAKSCLKFGRMTVYRGWVAVLGVAFVPAGLLLATEGGGRSSAHVSHVPLRQSSCLYTLYRPLQIAGPSMAASPSTRAPATVSARAHLVPHLLSCLLVNLPPVQSPAESPAENPPPPRPSLSHPPSTPQSSCPAPTTPPSWQSAPST
jgi:hypothetical protein